MMVDSNLPDHSGHSQVSDLVPPRSTGRTVAIALNDELSSSSVPRIVASGRGFVAEQILNLAFEHGVKVRQDSDLAEVLSAADVEADIPAEAFAAVAEILVYVYRANGIEPRTKPTYQGNLGWTHSRGKML